VEARNFTSAELNRLKAGLQESGRSAGDNIASLGRLITALDNRNNFLLVGFLNGLFMWDLRFAISLEKWKEKYHSQMGLWFNILGEADTIASFGTFYFNNPGFVFPVIRHDETRINARGIAHPLLPETERVSNDILIEKAGKINLVTGSNMAGKSTYLRAAGVNMVLAMAGAPVCAESFEFHPLPLYTSMRIGDSIQSRESTFYAELKRLKQIIEASEKEEILILLDEILKGTNSKDKLTGSRALIIQLIKNRASGIIATHDLALGDMEPLYPGNIKNYSFEVNIENEQFTFDFKLNEGICKTMNATQLMKKMGITIS
jgi:DNA mismatch repair ATPase MutS